MVADTLKKKIKAFSPDTEVIQQEQEQQRCQNLMTLCKHLFSIFKLQQCFQNFSAACFH